MYKLFFQKIGYAFIATACLAYAGWLGTSMNQVQIDIAVIKTTLEFMNKPPTVAGK